MKVSLPVAFWITGADRIKFNDAVNKGTYKCAPKTVKGSARQFDEADLVGLYIFGQLIDLLTVKNACDIACGVAAVARSGTWNFVTVTKATVESGNIGWDLYGFAESQRPNVLIEFPISDIKAKINKAAEAWTALESRG